MDFKSITIVVCATDENDSLKKTVRTLINTCQGDDIDKILIVKSKNSSDGCNTAASALEKEYPDKVQTMTQTRPYVGGAVRDGFDAALSSHVILLPSDLGIELEVIPLMIEKAKQNPETIIKTSRWLKKDCFHHYGASRKLANKCGQIFLKALFCSDMTDLTIPVQIMTTELYKSIDWQEMNFPILAEMVLIPLRLGTEFEEIPAVCYGRSEGKSKNSVKQTALYMKTALRVRFTPKEKLVKEKNTQ